MTARHRSHASAAFVRRLGRRLYHTPPAGFWRSLDGLYQDVRSLPARLRDPARRHEPWQTVHHVGGDYAAAGRETVRLLREYGGLRQDDRVLDIGCGNGRVAWPLAQSLGERGEYIGFDVSAPAIGYCRDKIGSSHASFTFHHVDVRNGVYNPAGSVEELDMRFPCANEAVTLAFAASVVTHLPWATIRHYLAETRRVLEHGGRALFTAFVLTPEVRHWAAQRRTALRLQPFGEHAMTSDPHWPENAMAYDESEFRKSAADAGLQVEAILAGQWRPEPTYAGGQDLLIMSKR